MTGDRDKKSSEMKDRMAGRFSGDNKKGKSDNSDNSDDLDNLDNPDKQKILDNSDNPDSTDGVNKEIDPKESWTGRMVYVPDGNDRVPNLLDAFDGEYQRFEYECDWDIRKQKHYYPVVIRHGMDNIKKMSGDEFTDCVDNLNLR